MDRASEPTRDRVRSPLRRGPRVTRGRARSRADLFSPSTCDVPAEESRAPSDVARDDADPLRRGLKVYVAWRDDQGRLLALEALRGLLAPRGAVT